MDMEKMYISNIYITYSKLKLKKLMDVYILSVSRMIRKNKKLVNTIGGLKCNIQPFLSVNSLPLYKMRKGTMRFFVTCGHFIGYWYKSK